jgi:hypothetical protein
MIGTILTLLFAAGEPATAEPAKERLICRRETPIGSLIARRKMCLTATEWEKRQKDGNEASRKLVYDNMGTTNCLNDGSCNQPLNGRPF